MKTLCITLFATCFALLPCDRVFAMDQRVEADDADGNREWARKIPPAWERECTRAIDISAIRNGRFKNELRDFGGTTKLVEELWERPNTHQRWRLIEETFSPAAELRFILNHCH